VQRIPAISDANGPEPQAYTYDLKPEEERQLRTKMLALAADAIRARAQQLAAEMAGPAEPVRPSPRHHQRTAAKPIQPDFENVQFRVFDLSNSNEPVLVLTANARLPQSSTARAKLPPDLPYMIALVARQDSNGDLHKALVNVTDSQHLDVVPRLELIDAVDADGDGRGELLFRQISDSGSGFVVYRVIGDQLYALFQGASGS